MSIPYIIKVCKMSLFICICLAFLMPIAESPFLIGVFVLGISIVRALIISEARSWLALLLFLIYVGGMLVTFAYFLALCPNQSVVFTPVVVFPLTLAFIFLQDCPGYQLKKSLEVYDIYRRVNLVSLVILGLILFLAIVRVVKIVRRSAGALRPLTRI